MADSPAWPNYTGEMVLTEIYLHQHTPSNGLFEIFHIYEFRNFMEQPQMPSFSTNCTEPDDLNKALLKMNHLDNLDTSEIQRRLVDCIEQDMSQQIVVYSGGQMEQYMQNPAGIPNECSQEFIQRLENNQNHEPHSMNASQGPTAENPLVISDVFGSISMDNAESPSLPHSTSSNVALNSPISNNTNNSSNADDRINDVINDVIRNASCEKPLPEERSQLVISSVYGGYGAIPQKNDHKLPKAKSRTKEDAIEVFVSPPKSPDLLIDASNGDIALVDVIATDDRFLENDSTILEKDESKTPNEDEMIEVLEHIPTLLETVDDDNHPLLSQLCESIQTEDGDESGENGDLSSTKTLDSEWWQSRSPPNITNLNGKISNDNDDQIGLPKMNIEPIDQIVLSDSDAEEVEIIETHEDAFRINQNVSLALAVNEDLSISKNILRDILYSDGSGKKRKRETNDDTDESSEHSKQPKGSDSEAEEVLTKHISIVSNSISGEPSPKCIESVENDVCNGTKLAAGQDTNPETSVDMVAVLECLEATGDESEPSVYECQVCNKKLQDEASFKTHMLNHTTANKCEKCMGEYKSLELLQRHMEHCLQQIDVSDSSASSDRNFGDATETKMDSKYVSFSLNSPPHSSMQLPTIIPETNSSIDENNESTEESVHLDKCPSAGTDPNKSEALIEIIDCKEQSNCSSDPDIKIYVCRICFKTIHHFDTFKLHMMTHHRDKNEAEVHICKECMEAFETRELLDTHWEKHVADGSLKESESVNSKRIERFVTDINGRTTAVYMCTDCNLQFPSKRLHSLHAKIHAHIRCEVCLKLFANRITMKNHVRMFHEA